VSTLTRRSIRRIAIVGPESSGKTSLAAALAHEFGAPWVAEVARAYVGSLGRPYIEADLVEIARQQVATEHAAAARARASSSSLLFCDTNLLVLSVWAEVVYGRVDPWIIEHERLEDYALHLLTEPDLPWQPDPWREAPSAEDRRGLFERYRERLADAEVPVDVVDGSGDARIRLAVAAVQRIL
jgi:NadR type nicotinamide-nucleotide adenylyltransferase